MSMIYDFQKLMQPSNDDAPGADVEPWRRDVLPPSTSILRDNSEILEAVVQSAHEALHNELISRIHAQPPEFFERLVIDVLLSMGYGTERSATAQRLGRSGDGGIDGVITLDELGFDLIYIQAKRLKPGIAVPISEIRDFAGSLESRQASKGVFVTTTHFSPGAAEFCSRLSRRVVLIDGCRLAEIMVRYNIGVEVRQCIVLKGVDAAYFAPLAMGLTKEGARS
jgi:restriction system protein